MPSSQSIFIAVGLTGFLILLISVVLGEIGGHEGEFGESSGDAGGYGGSLGDAGGHGGSLGDAGGYGSSLGDAGGHGAPLSDAGGNGGLLGDAGGHGGSLGDAGGQDGPLAGEGGDGTSLGDAGGDEGPRVDAGGHQGEACGTAPESQGIPEGSAYLDAPTWRSIRVLAIAMVGFGAAGFIADSQGVPAILSWPLAAAGFLAVGAATYRFILKPLAAQQYNSLTSRYGWIGRPAVVTLDILPHGIGQVTFHDRQGARITQTASSDLAEEIPKGAAVTITELTARGVVVHRSAFSD